MTLTAQRRQGKRFFSLTDTEMISSIDGKYNEQVKCYFRRLFPYRTHSVLRDGTRKPLPVDIGILYPTVEEPFYLIHTIGMSGAPMQYPGSAEFDAKKSSYGELYMMLPGNWPFSACNDVVDGDDPAAWPLHLLMELGRFPHVHKLWLSYGFVLPNTEFCEPFAPDTALSGLIIVQFDGELGEMKLADGTMLQLFMPILLYKEELDLYNTLGPDELIERILDRCDGSFLVDVKRTNIGLLQRE